MGVRAVGFLTIGLSVMVTAPALAQKKIDLSLRSQWTASDFQPSRHGDSPYYSSATPQRPPLSSGGLDLPLDVRTQGGTPAKLSLGSVGPDPGQDGSYRPVPGDNRYYFDTPNQRPPASATGLFIKIPLEDNNSR
jgi:hypothetical protein